jgi:hypothetical protein
LRLTARTAQGGCPALRYGPGQKRCRRVAAREAARWVHARSHALDWHALAGIRQIEFWKPEGRRQLRSTGLVYDPECETAPAAIAADECAPQIADRTLGCARPWLGPCTARLTFPDDQLKIGGNHLLYEVQMFSNTAALLESEGNWEWGCGPLAQGAKHPLSRQRTTLRGARSPLRFAEAACLTHDVALVRRPPKSVEDRHRVEVVAPASDLASLDCEHRDVPVGVGSSGPNDATL